MTAPTITSSAIDLASRLRELRESTFGGITITQRALGRAFGGNKPLSAPLISTWEKGTAVPTKKWIAAYATFFATKRSVESGSFRLLHEEELTEGERSERAVLEQELLSLRERSVRRQEARPPDDPRRALDGPWYFRDGKPVRIVCAERPTDQVNPEATPAHPSLAHGELYSFGSIDALFELFGHIRAANPRLEVRVVKESDLERDDFSCHLVVLGGVDWNPLMRIQERLRVPVRQVSTGDDPAKAYFEVGAGDTLQQHHPDLTNERELISDVGLFLRAPSPFNRRRTLTICAGLFSLGTYGVVRALTDERFHERNEQYLLERFAGSDTYSIVMRVDVLNGDEALTPDWTDPFTRLHEWP
ncbi:MAG TPA: hypothetical protein VFZ85_15115 [Jiangellaceae bacterium]